MFGLKSNKLSQRSLYQTLLKGMGVLTGAGSTNVRKVASRTDSESFQADLEAIGGDFRTVCGRLPTNMESLSEHQTRTEKNSQAN